MDESFQAAGDDLSKYTARLRRLPPIDQEGPAGEGAKQNARPFIGADHREPRLPGGGPAHHPCNQHLVG